MVEEQAGRHPADTGTTSSSLDLSRRALVGLGSLTLAGALYRPAHGQPSTPAPSATAEASPVASAVDMAALERLSVLLTGVDALPEAGFTPLAELISANPEWVQHFSELTAVTGVDELDGVSGDAQALAANITSFWYSGNVDGKPSPDREPRYFGLLSWQTVPYIVTPTLCKSFGYWAADVPATFDEAS